jgi:hypothetical protein
VDRKRRDFQWPVGPRRRKLGQGAGPGILSDFVGNILCGNSDSRRLCWLTMRFSCSKSQSSDGLCCVVVREARWKTNPEVINLRVEPISGLRHCRCKYIPRSLQRLLTRYASIFSPRLLRRHQCTLATTQTHKCNLRATAVADTVHVCHEDLRSFAFNARVCSHPVL